MVQPRSSSLMHIPRPDLTMAIAPLAICMCIGCAPQRKSYVTPRRPIRSTAAPRTSSRVSRPAPRPNPAPTSGATVLTVDGYQDFRRQVLAAPTPTVTMFYNPFCHSCKSMKPVYQAMAGPFGGSIKFTKVNASTNRDLVAQYNITAVPTFVLFKAGSEIKRLIGPQPAPLLRKALAELSGS